MAGSAIIRVDKLSKAFGKKRILDGISLEIRSGEIFGIAGMTGVGKTTLLECLIGFLIPDKGDVLFRPESLLEPNIQSLLYKSVFKEKNLMRQMCGFATQSPSLYDELTVEENLMYFGALYNLPDDVLKSNVGLVLKIIGFEKEKNTLAKNLSGGMRKILDIGCALIHNPIILFMDEPTADLDIISRRRIWNLIKRINQKGKTVVLASHFLNEMEDICTRIAIMHNGKMVGMGTMDEMRKQFINEAEVMIKSYPGSYEKVLAALKKSKAKFTSTIIKNGQLFIYTKHPQQVLHSLLDITKKRKEGIINLAIRRPKLREIFELLLKEK